LSQKLLTELLGPEAAAEVAPERRADIVQALVQHIDADASLKKRLAEIVQRELTNDLSGSPS
jgi:hypothetical protein